MKSLESKTEDTITVAEREAKQAIETKRTDTDKEIEDFKIDFENYRKEQLNSLHQRLISSVDSLTKKITLMS